MNILMYFLVFVEIVTCFLLIGVVLLQRSKSGGAAGGLAFGAGVGESLFGAQVGNVLTRTTVILAVVFLVNTTLLSYLGSKREPDSVVDSVSSAPVVPTAAEPVPGPEATPAPGSGPADAAVPDFGTVEDVAVPVEEPVTSDTQSQPE